MLEIRIHGRGGQGNVVAAYLLAAAAIHSKYHAQAFPAFGAERRGAPVAAFVRIDSKPVRRRCQVNTPDFLIIQDPALLKVAGTLEGLHPRGAILVNDSNSDHLHHAGHDFIHLSATELALEHVGKPLPNTALLAAFISLTALLPLTALHAALADRFKGEVLNKNLALVDAAAEAVVAGHWKEIADARS